MIQKLVRPETCGGCVFYRWLGHMGGGANSSAVRACHYCFDTGEPRGCPISECTRKRKRDSKVDADLRRQKVNPYVRHPSP